MENYKSVYVHISYLIGERGGFSHNYKLFFNLCSFPVILNDIASHKDDAANTR